MFGVDWSVSSIMAACKGTRQWALLSANTFHAPQLLRVSHLVVIRFTSSRAWPHVDECHVGGWETGVSQLQHCTRGCQQKNHRLHDRMFKSPCTAWYGYIGTGREDSIQAIKRSFLPHRVCASMSKYHERNLVNVEARIDGAPQAHHRLL